MKTINDIKPPRVLWDKPLEDYSKRLARRTGVSAAVVDAKYTRTDDACEKRPALA